MAGILFSCENDLNSIKLVTYDPHAPSEMMVNLDILHTDSGYAKVEIHAGVAETYYKPEQVTKLKNGLLIQFYDGMGSIVSTLTAKYGEVNHQTGLTFVQDSVVLINVEDQRRLETTKLYWNQNDSTIYSTNPVVIRSRKGIGYGSSIKSKQDFSWYVLTDPVGDVENTPNH